jgi:hypothetical protein
MGTAMRQCRYCGESRFGTELCCPACGELYADTTFADDDLDEEIDGLLDEHDASSFVSAFGGR